MPQQVTRADIDTMDAHIDHLKEQRALYRKTNNVMFSKIQGEITDSLIARASLVLRFQQQTNSK